MIRNNCNDCTDGLIYKVTNMKSLEKFSMSLIINPKKNLNEKKMIDKL